MKRMTLAQPPEDAVPARQMPPDAPNAFILHPKIQSNDLLDSQLQILEDSGSTNGQKIAAMQQI